MIKQIELQLGGVPVAIQNIGQLNFLINETRKALKSPELGSQAYQKLNQNLAKLKTVQSQVTAGQREQQREFVVAADKGRRSYRALNAELVNLRNKFREMSAEERKSAIGKQTIARVRQLDSELKKIDASIGNYHRNVGSYSQSLASFGRNVLGALGLVGGINLVVNGIKESIRTIDDFDASLKKLSSITGLTGDELDKLGQSAIRISGNFGTAAKEINEGFALVGSAAPQLLKNAEALALVTEQAEILQKAGGLELEQAVKAVTTAMNQFNLTSEDSAQIVDIFATSQQLGTARIEELVASLESAGATANAFGLDIEETNVLLQALAKGTVTGSEAGVKLRNILLFLAETGRDDLNPQLRDMRDILETLAEEIKTPTQAMEIFKKQNVDAALALINNRNVLDELNGKLNDAGNAMEQASINTDTLGTRLNRLSSAWDNFILSLDSGQGTLSTFLKEQTDSIADFLTLAGEVGLGSAISRTAFQSSTSALEEFRASGVGTTLQEGNSFNDLLQQGAVSTSGNEQLTSQAAEDLALLQVIIDKVEADRIEAEEKLAKEREKLSEKQAKARERELEQIKKNEEAQKRYFKGLKDNLDSVTKELDRLNKAEAEFNAELKKNREEFIENNPFEGAVGTGIFEEGVLRDFEAGNIPIVDLEKAINVARLREEKLFNEARAQNQKLSLEERVSAAQRAFEIEQELNRERIEEEKRVQEELKNIQRDTINTITNLLFEAAIERSRERQRVIDQQREEEIEAARAQYERELELYEGNTAQQQEAKKKLEETIQKINKKAFEDKKKESIKQTLINGAQAIIQALANTTLPFPASLTAAIPIAAATAAQVLQIKGQSLDEGGFTQSSDFKDHTGEKVAPNNIRLHGSEYVTPRKVLQTSKGRKLVEQLESMRLSMGYRGNRQNQMGFAEGGFISGSDPFGIPTGAGFGVMNSIRIDDETLDRQAEKIATRTANKTAQAVIDGLRRADRLAEREGRLNENLVQ